MITVAQAIHWFDIEKFYREVKRVAKKKTIIAILGYKLLRTNSHLDTFIHQFYTEIVGPYWDPERKLIDQKYQTIPFPFAEIFMPHYEMDYTWTLDELIGYFKTWSSVQHYIKKNHENPVEWIESRVRKHWPESKPVSISIEIITRIGHL